MPLTTYARTLVSGNKARYIDAETDVNLDLVYVTDRIIIMGYPATGMKALYRNRREDVLRFLNARHGDKWWIWNLCPLTENAYSSESMEGRVSRYPFPDHNPPPFPLLPLAVREMTAWLEGDAERIAIIHCKAGKGRSGTLLVSYLLSLPSLPPPPKEDGPQMDDSGTEDAKGILKEKGAHLGQGGADENDEVKLSEAEDKEEEEEEEDALSEHVGIDTDFDEDVPSDTAPALSKIPETDSSRLGGGASLTQTTTHVEAVEPVPDRPKTVYVPIAIGDEDPAGSAGQEDRADGKLDEIFVFHSSRRMKPSTTKARRGVSIASQRRWCRYLHLLFIKQAPTSYLNNTGTVRLLSVTLVLKRPHGWQKPLTSVFVGSKGGQGRAGATVARYKDDYVHKLRELGGGGEGAEGDITWGGVAGDGKFDSNKMFKVFAKLAPGDMADAARAELRPGEEDEYNIHHLTPAVGGGDIVLARGREFRLKLHLGSLPMGWAWFIPAFHLAEPSEAGSVVAFDVPRSQLDFPLGPGAAVHRVIMRLQTMDAVN